MPVFNVVNPNAVEEFLYDIAEGDGRLFVLLRQCLTRALLREEAALDLLRRRPVPPPTWLSAERFATDGPFYQFNAVKLAADPRLCAAVRAVKRWLKEALLERQSWAVEENGRPRTERLKNIGHLQHVLSLIEKDRKQALAHGVLPKMSEKAQSDTEVVLHLSHGWEWRRLLTPEALRQEGLMMRNCLSSNARYATNVLLGSHQYYSLRDFWGRAWVTIEVRDSVVTEKRGRANSAPAERYLAPITALYEAEGWTGVAPFPERWRMPKDFGQDSYYSGAVETFDGHLDWRGLAKATRIPFVLRVSGTLDLRGATELRVLPRILSVGGNLLLDGAINLHQMPNWLWVAGDLDMRGCRGVKVLGAQTAVRGDMCLNDCTGLQRLPRQMRVGRTLDLRGCDQITWMSQEILVLGEILIGDTRSTTVEAAHCLLDAQAKDRR